MIYLHSYNIDYKMEHYFYENNNIYRLDEEKFNYGIYHILYHIGSISENKFIFSMLMLLIFR